MKILSGGENGLKQIVAAGALGNSVDATKWRR